jgi:chromosome segregation ATPase
MADLSIRIKADTVSAVQQFDELARSSKTVEEQIRKTAESFKTESTQEFIDRQKLAGAAITATRGELASITAQTKAYEKNIESMIKSGISPEDSAVTKLQTELEALRGRQENLTRSTREGRQSAEEFAKKQETARAAISATRGPQEALKKSTADYEKEIERLIKSGLDPQSEHIKALQKDYQNLKAQTDSGTESTKGIKEQLADMIPGIGAAVAAYKALGSVISEVKHFMDESIQAYTEQEVTLARTEAVLNASGAAAWTTAGQMKDMASAMSDSTGRSKEEILNMQNVLLGFTSVTGDNFQRLSKNIIDMADVMGGDLSSQANAFGKALDSPTKGMAALSRYGFVFTE